MKRLRFSALLLLLLVAVAAHAQNRYQDVGTHTIPQPPHARRAVVNMATLTPGPDASVLYTAPVPRTDSRSARIRAAKVQAQAQRDAWLAQHPDPATEPTNKTGLQAATTAPLIINNFQGNTFGGSLPNDNDIAVSDEGYIVSVVNTKIDIYDTTGARLESTTLSSFGSSLGFLFFTFDPKVIYDPVNQRFIIVYLNGSSSTNSAIIVAFSQTSDPTGNWNLYELPGNAVNANSWTDYPSIGISNEDLFIGLNAFSDNDEFVATYMYQVVLANGYAGTPLQSRVINNITQDGQPIFNITPITGGSAPTSVMYFITNESDNSNGQTVGLYKLTTPFSVSPTASLQGVTVPVNRRYGPAPNAPQVLAAKQLNTNDSRVLGGFIENDVLHFVFNTVSHVTAGGFGTASVYYGYILDASFDPLGYGQYVQHPLFHFAFPDICYIGTGPGDNQAAIGFNVSSTINYPGAGVVVIDSSLAISEAIVFKNGDGGLDVSGDAVERWGDYTGIGRWGNHPGQAWIGACYGTEDSRNATWIAQIGASSQPTAAPDAATAPTRATVFPNPSVNSQRVTVRASIPATGLYTFRLVDMQGRTVQVLIQDRVRAANEIEFSFTPTNLPAGVYNLVIERGTEAVATQPVVIQ